MQRLFLYKLLPKPPKNLFTPSSNPSFLLPPKTPSHNPHQFFTHYTTFSHSKNAIITQPSNLPNGFLSNSIIAKHFSKSIHSKFQNNGVSGTLYGYGKALFSRRSFHSLNSYGGGWSGKALFSRRSFQSLNSYGGGGWRSGYHWLTSDNVILALIISNVAVFMLWRVADRQFMIKNFMISVDNLRNGRIHTLITHAFSHIDTFHVVSNMLGLYFFGTSIGRNFGPTYLLKLYLAGAVVGAVFHLVHHALKSPSIRGFDGALGASGAVNAIMLLEIFLFPRNTIYLEFFIPMPAFVLGILIIGKDVWRIWKGDSRISGGSHLGGATVAAVAWALVRRRIY